MTIDIDRQKIARYGINVSDVHDIITTAVGGKPATQVYEGERRFQLTLRFPEPWSIAPLVRLHTQNAARFYLDPVYSFLGAPFPPGWLESPPATLSLDQRLAAFGARTWGLKLAVSAGGGWSGELRAERYRQRGE